MTELAALIKLRAGRPRSKVAKELGITTQMLGALERGDRLPSLMLAKKIAVYYGVTIDDLFFQERGNKTSP
ncbi:MAG: helix-turn-helix domain-containing protein [Firmicutes bacterium]|nr:helix-turn-helix domain-containing protein [Bacillota bacterium]